MLKKNISAMYLLFMFILYATAGSMILLWPQKLLHAGSLLLVSIAFLNICSVILGFFINKNKFNSFGYTVFYVCANGLLFYTAAYRQKIFTTLLFIFFGLWIILNSIFRFIKGIQYKKNAVPGGLSNIILGGVLLLYGSTLIVLQGQTHLVLLWCSAIYMYLYALCYLYDFCIEISRKRYSLEQKYRFVQISMPAIIAAFIPTRLLCAINTMFADSNVKQIIHQNTHTQPLQQTQNPKAEIFIHSAPDVVGKMGHVDIRIENKIYSFGNYDPSSYKIFGIMGDGVLEIVSDKEAYIDFCIRHSQKTIVGFGLDLNENQLRLIQKKIKTIMQKAYPWYPRICTQQKTILLSDEWDYASALYKATHARFYKFKSGKFKSFAGFSTNCVMLAKEILGTLGTEVIALEGFITPGTFYEMLNNAFCKKNGFVLMRTIYRDIPPSPTKKKH